MLARQSATGEDDSFIPRAIVHRLDRGTTGLMIVAKTADAEAHLTEQFKARTTRKRYVALVCGRRPAAAGAKDAPTAGALPTAATTLEADTPMEVNGSLEVNAALEKDPSRPGKMRVASAGEGKAARSILTLHGYDKEECVGLLTVELLTGRQHQVP